MFRGFARPLVNSFVARVVVDDAGRDIVCPFANVSQVRWRKRRWVPLTPSKLFVVRQRTAQDPAEYEELKTLSTNYRTTLRSIV